MADDEEYFGNVVVALNTHGVAEAFGPYLSEDESHEVAWFAEHLVPTWLVDLDAGTVERYGMDSSGTLVERPSTFPPRPTRAGALQIPRAKGPARPEEVSGG